MPALLLEHRAGTEIVTKSTHQILKHAQRQALPSLAVRLAAAGDATQTRHMRTGGVAVQNLQDKQVHGGYRIKDALTPNMTDRVAHATNEFRTDELSHFGLDLPH